MGNEAFLEPQDSSAPANGQIIRRAYFSSRHFCQYFSLHRADSWLLLEICCWVSVFELALTVTHDQSVMTHWQVEGLHFISLFTKEKWIKKKIPLFWVGGGGGDRLRCLRGHLKYALLKWDILLHFNT